MAIILSTRNLIEAAHELVADIGGTSEAAELEAAIQAIEEAQGRLAQLLGDMEGVTVTRTAYEPLGEVYSGFLPGSNGQRSAFLAKYDEDGDWD